MTVDTQGEEPKNCPSILILSQSRGTVPLKIYVGCVLNNLLLFCFSACHGVVTAESSPALKMAGPSCWGGDIVSLSGLPRNKCVCAAHGVVITPATTGNTSLETGGCMKGGGGGGGR